MGKRQFKFLLESNLFKLAKWLRFLGHDVKMLKGKINTKVLIANQDRIFITTSRKWEDWLKKARIDYLVIPRHDWKLQVCMVLKHFGLEFHLLLNKCAHCGSKLTVADKERFRNIIPTRAYETAYDFTYCSNCGALFWKGTHYEGMKRVLEEIKFKC